MLFTLILDPARSHGSPAVPEGGGCSEERQCEEADCPLGKQIEFAGKMPAEATYSDNSPQGDQRAMKVSTEVMRITMYNTLYPYSMDIAQIRFI